MSNKRLPKTVANRQDSNIKVFSTAGTKERAPLARRLFPSPSRPGATESRPGIAERDRHTVSHSARIWNYWLGGKDNYPVDREVGDRIREIFPDIVEHRPRASGRSSPARSAIWPVRPASASSSTSAPGCRPSTTPTRSPSASLRIPGSSTSTTTLWSSPTPARCSTSTPEGATDYIDADLRDPGRDPQGGRPHPGLRPARRHHAARTSCGTSRRRRGPADHRPLLDAVPSGSYLAIADRTNEVIGGKESTRRYASGTTPVDPRHPPQAASRSPRSSTAWN